MDTVRAIEIVLSRLKLDNETASALKYHLDFARREAERERRAQYRDEQKFFDQG